MRSRRTSSGFRQNALPTAVTWSRRSARLERGRERCPLQVLREGVLFMSESFRLDQPRANDLVGNPLLIAGSGGGFEADIAVRVLDGNGQVLVETSVTSTNLTSAWQTRVSLPEPPPTNRGVVQVGPSTGADEAPPRVSVPVFYGTAIAGSAATSCTPSKPGTRCPASPCRRRRYTSASASSRSSRPTGTSSVTIPTLSTPAPYCACPRTSSHPLRDAASCQPISRPTSHRH